MQQGLYPDYYTGKHEPSFSLSLRPLIEATDPADYFSPKFLEAIRAHIHPDDLKLFAQLNIHPSSSPEALPPTFFNHGGNDTAVPVNETIHMHRLVQESGVKTELVILEGEDHVWDVQPGAEEKYGEVMDRMASWLLEPLLQK
jgi:acetyl esterase/lipase